MALAAGVLSAGCDACTRKSPQDATKSPLAPSASSPGTVQGAPDRQSLRELTWDYPSTPVGPMRVVVSVPAEAREPLPVLVALHGRGETLKGPRRGARGWIDDYGLHRAVQRLHAPPLVADDLKGLASEAQLQRLNTILKQQPYHDLIVVCPYTPALLGGEGGFGRAPAYADFIVDEVLPRVRRETPARSGARSTGIDGVSLGGRGALLVGLLRPQAFRTVGALQAAFGSDELERLARLAQRAREHNPQMELRLVTSDEDSFLNVNRAIGRALSQRGVPHQLKVVDGPHDYVFNRGPGVYEMLVFHSRALHRP